MLLTIRLDDLRGAAVHALLEEHLRDMHAWSDDDLLGCCTLREPA